MDVKKSCDEIKEDEYTAVVSFHGMGEPRRYEEVSRLVDALDGYNNDAYNYEKKKLGPLICIRGRLEAPRGERDKDVGYVQVYHKPPASSEDCTPNSYRFYEAYWAPLTAGGVNFHKVLLWMMYQIFIPWHTLFTFWRHRQRLRRAALHNLWAEQLRRCNSVYEAADYSLLAQTYHDFERADSRRNYQRGSFRQYHDFLKEKLTKEKFATDVINRLLLLATLWHSCYRRIEWRNLFVLFTLGLAVGLGALAFLAAAAGIIDFMAATEPTFDIEKLFNKEAMGLAISLLSLFGVTRFLSCYMGDVMIWTTYEETEENYQKRHAILRHGVELLSHILSDPKCKRVVVVGHSLGSAVAMDALLQLGRHNRAREQNPMNGPLLLKKIDQFVTMGSPIDKVHYLFESRTGKYHRYNRVVQQVRGDIGTVPFFNGIKPHIHWVNYWDEGDVISGSLESPSNDARIHLRVDNVQVNNYSIPDPGVSHTGYFRNRNIIKDLFNIIFLGNHSYHGVEREQGEWLKMEETFVGPGNGMWYARFHLRLMMAVPWLLLIAAVTHCYFTDWSMLPFVSVGLIFLYLVVTGVANRIVGPRHPVKSCK